MFLNEMHSDVSSPNPFQTGIMLFDVQLITLQHILKVSTYANLKCALQVYLLFPCCARLIVYMHVQLKQLTSVYTYVCDVIHM